MRRFSMQPAGPAAPASPITLDLSQCVQDEQGNMFCPIVEDPAPAPAVAAAPATAPIQAVVVAAPAPAVAAPATAPIQAVVVAAPAPVTKYASDDNLSWPPPGMNDANCGCIIVKPEQQTALALPRPRSLTDLSQIGARNIDNGAIMINAMPQAAAYNNPGYFGDSNRTLIVTRPMHNHPVSNFYQPRMAPMIMSGTMPPGAMGYPPPKPGIAMDSRYPRQSVNMRRAIGFAIIMSCLCPPIGLFGLCTALRGNHNNRRGHTKRAVRYRRASYSFSVMALILIVLGIVIIVLLSQKYKYY